MLNNFSGHEVKQIQYFNEPIQDRLHYTIVVQLLDGECTIFRLREEGTHKYIEKTAQEIARNAELLNAMSHEDAHLVGYVVASEKLLNDRSWFLTKKCC